jgi:hypothetical protein
MLRYAHHDKKIVVASPDLSGQSNPYDTTKLPRSAYDRKYSDNNKYSVAMNILSGRDCFAFPIGNGLAKTILEAPTKRDN